MNIFSMRWCAGLAVLSILFAALSFPAAGQTPAPTDGIAYPEWFADPGWIADRLGDEQLTIVALTPADEFAAGHIPGAAQIDWPALEIVETSEASIETWQGVVEGLLTDLGIHRGDTVVVYDGGTFWAARLWWILHFLGHEDVRILNGGLQAWTAADGEIATGPSTAVAAEEPYSGQPNDDVVVTIDKAVAEFEAGNAIFVDARSASEFAEGHIPGAVNVPFIANAVDGDTKYWKPVPDLLAMYDAAGVTPGMRVIPYCSTGVRSAVTWFTLRQIGFEDVSLFTGSFVEWTSDPSRPVETA